MSDTNPTPGESGGDPDGTTDGDAAVTVLARMTAAGIAESRVREHIAAGVLTVDGVAVSDLIAPAAPGTRLVIKPR